MCLHFIIERQRLLREKLHSFPQPSLWTSLYLEKLKGMTEDPSKIYLKKQWIQTTLKRTSELRDIGKGNQEINVGYFWLLAKIITTIGGGEIRFSPSLRKNSRKSPSLARRGILRNLDTSHHQLARRGILEGNVSQYNPPSILTFTSGGCTRDQTSGKASPEEEVRAHHTCQILLLTSITIIGGLFYLKLPPWM